MKAMRIRNPWVVPSLCLLVLIVVDPTPTNATASRATATRAIAGRQELLPKAHDRNNRHLVPKHQQQQEQEPSLIQGIEPFIVGGVDAGTDYVPDPELELVTQTLEPKDEPGISTVHHGAHRFPWFVRQLGYDNNTLTGCAGSLVAPDLVLTAAHCDDPDRVLVGPYDLRRIWKDNHEGAVRRDVEDVVRHPGWRPDQKLTITNDVMLVKLDGMVRETEPVRLNFHPGVPSEAGEELLLLGFGSVIGGPDTDTPYGPNRQSTILQEAPTKYVPLQDCAVATSQDGKARYGTSLADTIVTEDWLCTLHETTGTCYGDSGGPVLLEGTDPTTDVLVGVVSGASGYCGHPDLPLWNNRVSAHRDWIRTVGCRLSEAPPEDWCCDAMVDDAVCTNDDLRIDPRAALGMSEAQGEEKDPFRNPDDRADEFRGTDDETTSSNNGPSKRMMIVGITVGVAAAWVIVIVAIGCLSTRCKQEGKEPGKEPGETNAKVDGPTGNGTNADLELGNLPRPPSKAGNNNLELGNLPRPPSKAGNNNNNNNNNTVTRPKPRGLFDWLPQPFRKPPQEPTEDILSMRVRTRRIIPANEAEMFSVLHSRSSSKSSQQLRRNSNSHNSGSPSPASSRGKFQKPRFLRGPQLDSTEDYCSDSDNDNDAAIDAVPPPRVHSPKPSHSDGESSSEAAAPEETDAENLRNQLAQMMYGSDRRSKSQNSAGDSGTSDSPYSSRKLKSRGSFTVLPTGDITESPPSLKPNKKFGEPITNNATAKLVGTELWEEIKKTEAKAKAQDEPAEVVRTNSTTKPVSYSRKNSPRPGSRKASPKPVSRKNSKNPPAPASSPKPVSRKNSPRAGTGKTSPKPLSRKNSPRPGSRKPSPKPLSRKNSPRPGSRKPSPPPLSRKNSPRPGSRKPSPKPLSRKNSPRPGSRKPSPKPLSRKNSPRPGSKKPLSRKNSPKPMSLKALVAEGDKMVEAIVVEGDKIAAAIAAVVSKPASDGPAKKRRFLVKQESERISSRPRRKNLVKTHSESALNKSKNASASPVPPKQKSKRALAKSSSGRFPKKSPDGKPVVPLPNPDPFSEDDDQIPSTILVVAEPTAKEDQKNGAPTKPRSLKRTNSEPSLVSEKQDLKRPQPHVPAYLRKRQAATDDVPQAVVFAETQDDEVSEITDRDLRRGMYSRTRSEPSLNPSMPSIIEIAAGTDDARRQQPKNPRNKPMVGRKANDSPKLNSSKLRSMLQSDLKMSSLPSKNKPKAEPQPKSPFAKTKGSVAKRFHQGASTNKPNSEWVSKTAAAHKKSKRKDRSTPQNPRERNNKYNE